MIVRILLWLVCLCADLGVADNRALCTLEMTDRVRQSEVSLQ